MSCDKINTDLPPLPRQRALESETIHNKMPNGFDPAYLPSIQTLSFCSVVII